MKLNVVFHARVLSVEPISSSLWCYCILFNFVPLPANVVWLPKRRYMYYINSFLLNINMETNYTFLIRCTTSGPRVTSGPQRVVIWPAMCNMNSNYFRTGVVGLHNPSGVEICPESVVIGSRDQLLHKASAKLRIVNSRFLERQHNNFSSFQLLLTLKHFINPVSTYTMIFPPHDRKFVI